MPLIVMCGIPGAGKSRRARDIKEYLELKHNSSVVIINEEGMDLRKEEAYKDAH
jgi:tRNA uridine 5-carbamoylmethylation protein Kti12